MFQAVLLLGCALLSLVAAFPNGALTLQTPVRETEHWPERLSKQTPSPDPSTCQDLLHTMPSLAPLPEYLSNIALRVALEEVGCPAEAHSLQLHLLRMGEKDTIETLIHESQNRNEEVNQRNLGGFTGEFKRVRRSVTLPEECTSKNGWIFYEAATLMAEFADRLPSTNLVTEFKTSAVEASQKCTEESWNHLEEVSKRLIESPDFNNVTLSKEDQIYFVVRMTTFLKNILVSILQEYFSAYREGLLGFMNFLKSLWYA